MSFHLHPLSILNFFSATTSFFLGIFVFTKNSKDVKNFSFFLVTCAAFIWLFCYAIAYSMPPNQAEFFFRIGNVGVSFLPATFLLFYYFIIFKKKMRVIILISTTYTLPAFIWSYLTLNTNYLYSGLYHYSWGYYLKATGDLYKYFLPWFLIGVVFFTILLFHKLKTEKNLAQKTLLKYQLSGFLFFSMASIDFLPKLGFNVLPLGCLFVLFFCFTITYAIIKHKILGIEILIKKGLVYTILISLVSVLYLLFVIILERAFAYFFHYQSVGISIAAAFAIGLLVFPLRNKIQQIMDRYFFSGTQTEIYEKNLKLQAEIEQAQRLKTATTLASGLAHEIKNPLTAITTFAEYLKDKKDDPEFINNFSKIVGQEADRINDLVNQLTDFAKPGESKIEPNDIHHLIKETLQFLTSQCLKQSIKVELAYQTPDTVTLNIDAKQIKQVLMNIILNAIEAMPDGGAILIRDEIVGMTTDRRPQTMDQTTQGHTDTRTHEKELEQKNSRQTTDKEQNTDNKHQEPHERNNAMSANKRSSAEPKTQDLPDASCQIPDTFYRLSIIDTGPGISPADIPHLFDPFFSKKDQGTGLGLSVSYGIIEKHGGRLYAENNPDGGAVFIMEFPMPN